MAAKEGLSDMETVSDLLDKLEVYQLHLMEDTMICELNIQTSLNNGIILLAKSRYIMGQNSVSKERLPTESSSEFSASLSCEAVEEDSVRQLKLIENSNTSVNPMHWFGVLVSKNLHTAKGLFQKTVSHIVECVNIQLQILENMRNIKVLKHFKESL